MVHKNLVDSKLKGAYKNFKLKLKILTFYFTCFIFICFMLFFVHVATFKNI